VLVGIQDSIGGSSKMDRFRKQVPPVNAIPLRSGRASFLIEALVSVVIISIVIAGVMDGYAKIRAFSVQSQTELQAAAMAQECIDQLRAQDFTTTLLPNVGTAHAVPVTGSSPTGDALFPRPLLRDSTMTYYNNGQVNDTQNVIHVTNNTVSVSLQQGAAADIIAVTVIINWSDGRGTHNYTMQTNLAANGLNG
jgi:type II secretory pathway pseudopilin PulG